MVLIRRRGDARRFREGILIQVMALGTAGGSRRGLRLLMPVAGIALLLVFLQWIPASDSTLFRKAVFNAGHAPLFGLVALLLLGLSRTALSGIPRASIVHYVVAFAAAVGVGLLSELYQFVGPRDADPLDLLRNGAGAFAFLLLAASRNRDADPKRGSRGVGLAIPLRAAAILTLGAVCAPVLLVAHGYWSRDRAFPVLCECDSAWARTFLYPKHAVLESAVPPAGWPDAAGGPVFKLALRYPGASLLVLREPYPDWTGYGRLRLEIYNGETAPVSLDLRVKDGGDYRAYEDRFRRTLRLAPGANVVLIPFDEIRQAAPGRITDLTRIRSLSLALPRGAPGPVTVYVGEITLL